MSDVTRILAEMEAGDPQAAEKLLPLVYEELRKLAAAKLAQEQPGQTLQATALVHEAYLRLVGGGKGSGFGVQGSEADREQEGYPHPSPLPKGEGEERQWDSRGHFFAAAAEAMRRILVERARCKQSGKHGGEFDRLDADLDHLPVISCGDPLEVLSMHEALDSLAEKAPRRAELVKLRYFLGCTMAETAQILGIAQATAEEDWTYAKAWLRRHLRRGEEKIALS